VQELLNGLEKTILDTTNSWLTSNPNHSSFDLKISDNGVRLIASRAKERYAEQIVEEINKNIDVYALLAAVVAFTMLKHGTEGVFVKNTNTSFQKHKDTLLSLLVMELFLVYLKLDKSVVDEKHESLYSYLVLQFKQPPIVPLKSLVVTALLVKEAFSK
jgi:hypothetical protein